jgi:SpoVK/Ycf46/Vps4 family AAA+-type ATPase
MWFGGFEANVRNIFDEARAAAPAGCSLKSWFQLPKPEGTVLAEVLDVQATESLTRSRQMDGMNANVLIISATGRLDQLIDIPLPNDVLSVQLGPGCVDSLLRYVLSVFCVV